MKIIKLVFVYALLSLITLNVESCKKDSACSNCGIKPSSVSKVYIDDDSTECSIWEYNSGDSLTKWMIQPSTMNQQQFDNIIFGLKSEFVNSFKNIYCIVIYTNINKNNDGTYTYNNKPESYSLYYLSDNQKLNHILIKQENNKEVVLHYTNVEVPGVVTKQIEYYQTNIVKANSFLMFYNKSLIGKFTPKKKMKLKYFNDKKVSIEKSNRAPKGQCGPGCKDNPPHTYCMGDPYGSMTCYADGGPSDPCGAQVINNYYMNNNSSNALPLELMHNFRDSFMSKYNLTNEYISYYYSISTLIKIDNSSILIHTYNTYLVCEVVMRKLLDYENNLNEPLMTTSQKDQLIDLINRYKNLTDDPVKLDQLNSLSNTIYIYYTMNIEQFINSIS